MTAYAQPDVRRRFRIAGRVQAVGFRAWTLSVARELRLRGTVRNRPDGTVDVEAAGEAADVDRFRVRLAEGPPLAAVSSVTELEPGRRPLPPSFRIA